MGPELDAPDQKVVSERKTTKPNLSPAEIWEKRFDPDVVYKFVMDFLDDIAAGVGNDLTKLPANQNHGFNALVASADYFCDSKKPVEFRFPNQVYVEFCNQIGTNLNDLVNPEWYAEHCETVSQTPSEDTYGA